MVSHKTTHSPEDGALRFPQKVGLIHFIGIGGIGMSGIAELLHNLGYAVQGSDSSESVITQRLSSLGIPVMIGQSETHIDKAQVIVISSAIKAGNPELEAARLKHLPVVRRADMLGELMRLKRSIAVAGTHGKTTTTTLIATLLDGSGWDPTVINGGIINAFGSNARLGAGDWMVVEADESDGSFLRLPCDVALVSNIDPEHLDHYGNFDSVRSAFYNFIDRLPFYGFGVMCLDHPEVQALLPMLEHKRLITYGTNPQADVILQNVRQGSQGTVFDVLFQGRDYENRLLQDLSLPMPGQHNALNATGSLALASALGIPDDALRSSLQSFKGVKRRFTYVGDYKSCPVYDDYGHHPVEIRAALSGARPISKHRVIAVFQPHRYSRLHDLFDDFCQAFYDADIVIIAPVYAAGETAIAGVSGEALAEGIRKVGHRCVRTVENEETLSDLISTLIEPDDLILCLGAGSITHWANRLASKA